MVVGGAEGAYITSDRIYAFISVWVRTYSVKRMYCKPGWLTVVGVLLAHMMLPSL